MLTDNEGFPCVVCGLATSKQFFPVAYYGCQGEIFEPLFDLALQCDNRKGLEKLVVAIVSTGANRRFMEKQVERQLQDTREQTSKERQKLFK